MFCHVQIAARLRFKANVTALRGASPAAFAWFETSSKGWWGY